MTRQFQILVSGMFLLISLKSTIRYNTHTHTDILFLFFYFLQIVVLKVVIIKQRNYNQDLIQFTAEYLSPVITVRAISSEISWRPEGILWKQFFFIIKLQLCNKEKLIIISSCLEKKKFLATCRNFFFLKPVQAKVRWP